MLDSQPLDPRIGGLVALLMFVAPLISAAAPPDATLYERIEASLKKSPPLMARVGRPPPELEQVKWMIGTWDITARVFATSTTPERVSQGTSTVAPTLDGTWLEMRESYAAGTQDLGYLSYDFATKRWISLSIDSTPGARITYAGDWQQDRLVFSGPPVQIVDQEVTLRQTLEKRSDREYRILNEERLANGIWVALDEYVYRKK